jgi:hypothetical protein
VEAVAAVDKAAAALAEQPELEPTFMPEGAYGGGRAPDEPPNHGNKVGAHCCCAVDGPAAWFATFDVLPTEWASEWAARLCHLLAALLSHCACLPPCLRVSACVCLPACPPACLRVSACLLVPLQEAPRGHPDCLTGKTFVVSGVLDSLKREEAEDFIKRHGGKVG